LYAFQEYPLLEAFIVLSFFVSVHFLSFACGLLYLYHNKGAKNLQHFSYFLFNIFYIVRYNTDFTIFITSSFSLFSLFTEHSPRYYHTRKVLYLSLHENFDFTIDNHLTR